LEPERYMPVPSSKLHMIDGLHYNQVWLCARIFPNYGNM
jgi:hypothetical protein